jgi:hypothetical protein
LFYWLWRKRVNGERVVEMCTVDTEYSSLEERETGRGLGLGSERGMGRGREQD